MTDHSNDTEIWLAAPRKLLAEQHQPQAMSHDEHWHRLSRFQTCLVMLADAGGGGREKGVRRDADGWILPPDAPDDDRQLCLVILLPGAR